MNCLVDSCVHYKPLLKKFHPENFVIEPYIFAQRAASQPETSRFAAEGGFIPKTAKQGDGITSLKSAS